MVAFPDLPLRRVQYRQPEKHRCPTWVGLLESPEPENRLKTIFLIRRETSSQCSVLDAYKQTAYCIHGLRVTISTIVGIPTTETRICTPR
jgi:hypothetical protein